MERLAIPLEAGPRNATAASTKRATVGMLAVSCSCVRYAAEAKPYEADLLLSVGRLLATYEIVPRRFVPR